MSASKRYITVAVFAWICAAPVLAGMPVAIAAPATRSTARKPPCLGTRDASLAYLGKIVKAARALGVPTDYPLRHRLAIEPEAKVLVVAEKDIYGRPLRLVPAAASALVAMQAAAAHDQVTLQAVSGYRSFSYQLGLVRRRLDNGLTLEQALRVNDLPGYSEHQSGCAVDLTTPGVAPVTAAFAKTAAYRWLARNAARFGFHLSYGPGNRHGVEFEPWHWRFTRAGVADKKAEGEGGYALSQ